MTNETGNAKGEEQLSTRQSCTVSLWGCHFKRLRSSWIPVFKQMKACGITIQRRHIQVSCITPGGFHWFAYGLHNLLCFSVQKEELNVNISPQLSLSFLLQFVYNYLLSHQAAEAFPKTQNQVPETNFLIAMKSTWPAKPVAYLHWFECCEKPPRELKRTVTIHS